MKKYRKYLIIILPILFLIIVLFAIYINFNKTDSIVEENIFTSIDLNNIQKDQLIEVDLQIQEYNLLTNFFSNEFLDISSYLKKGYPEYSGGPCHISNRIILINFEDKYYQASLENLYFLFNPENEDEYYKFLNAYYDFNTKFCGTYFVEESSETTYKMNDGVCEGKVKINPRLEKIDSDTYYYHYILSHTSGGVFEEYFVKYADGSMEIISSQEKIFDCGTYIIY